MLQRQRNVWNTKPHRKQLSNSLASWKPVSCASWNDFERMQQFTGYIISSGLWIQAFAHSTAPWIPFNLQWWVVSAPLYSTHWCIRKGMNRRAPSYKHQFSHHKNPLLWTTTFITQVSKRQFMRRKKEKMKQVQQKHCSNYLQKVARNVSESTQFP